MQGEVMAKEVNTVVCAMRKLGGPRKMGAVLGYFDTAADVPSGWKICDTEFDITDVMQHLHIKRDDALRIMNMHWRDFQGRPTI